MLAGSLDPAVIYFDANATLPLHPAARRAWLETADRLWHNPSGLYGPATAARELLEDRRERLASILGCEPARVVFFSGATAANNALARHVGRSAGRSAPEPALVLISGGEHPCVSEPLEAALPGSVEQLPCDQRGVVLTERLAARISPPSRPAGGIALVSIMAASNETGVVQPWRDALSICRAHGVPFHTDAAQWLGKLPAAGLGECDWVTGSGHKLGGPRGSGFLVVPQASGFRGDLGGPQEEGRQAGTEDVAAVAGMVAALEAHEANTAAERAARETARNQAESRLAILLPEAVIVGRGADRLWNTLAVVVPGADGRKLVARLASLGVAASTGSACSAGAGSAARILTAIGAEALGLEASDLRGLVRLSATSETTAADWLTAVEALAAAARSGASLPRVSL